MEKLFEGLDKNIFTSELVSALKESFDKEVNVRVDTKVKEAIDAISFFDSMINDKKIKKLKESNELKESNNKERIAKLKKNMCERMSVIEAQAIKNVENIYEFEMDKLDVMNKRNQRKLKESNLEVIKLNKTIKNMQSLIDEVQSETKQYKRKLFKESKEYSDSINELTNEVEELHDELDTTKAELSKYKRKALNDNSSEKIADLEAKLEEAIKDKLIAENSLGMTLPQMEKFKELAYKCEYTDEKSFTKLIKGLKESKSEEKVEDKGIYSRFF